MRSTSGSSSSRLVMTAETCGSDSMPRNVAPPLKSTSTKLRISEEWVAASPRTRVRTSSLLPEPVAPMMRPCGPMPPWADSLMSSSTMRPSAPSPIGTRSRLRGARGRHSAGISRWRGSATPSRSLSVMLVASTSCPSPLLAVEARSGASWRARPSAWRKDSRSGRPSPVTSSLPAWSSWTRLNRSGRTSSRSVMPSSVRAVEPLRSMTVTPWMASAPSWESCGTYPPSTITTWYGRASTEGPGLNLPRSFSSPPSSLSRSLRSSAMSRTGPAASVSSGCRACGSHLTHSHWAIQSLPAHTATRMSSGEWKTASCPTSARTRSRMAFGSPVGTMRAKEWSAMAIGRSSTVEWAPTKRRSAPADMASRSSTGLDSGGMSCTARRWVPVPTRTVAKSPSRGLRSHRRGPMATDHSESGSGPFQWSASRCWRAALRTFFRVCDR